MTRNEPLTAEQRSQAMDSVDDVEHIATEPIDIANMPVDIRFEAGRIRTSIDELSRMQPGYTYELGHTLADQLIDITANGALIARGELVNIGDQLGVRITALARKLPATG